MVVLHGGQVFEFKMADGEGVWDAAAQKAFEQMQDKDYTDKYRNW